MLLFFWFYLSSRSIGKHTWKRLLSYILHTIQSSPGRKINFNKGSITHIFAVIQKCFRHDRGFRLFQKWEKNKMLLCGKIRERIPTDCSEWKTLLEPHTDYRRNAIQGHGNKVGYSALHSQSQEFLSLSETRDCLAWVSMHNRGMVTVLKRKQCRWMSLCRFWKNHMPIGDGTTGPDGRGQ